MGQITINGLTYKSLDECWGVGGRPLAGVYYSLDPFGEAPRASAPEYEELSVTFPGVDGVGIKRFGFRGRDIFITLCLIGADKAAVENQWLVINASITQLNRFTIVLPGGTTFQGCKLVKGGGRLIRHINFNNYILGIADLELRQLSVSN